MRVMRITGAMLTMSVMATLSAKDACAQKGVMLMNRIGPTSSVLYVSNADGTGEHPLLNTLGLDYHASWSADRQWVIFTSERDGLGQANIFRVHPDGAGLERLTDDPALDDQAVLSPDGGRVAFVSTRGTHRANVWGNGPGATSQIVSVDVATGERKEETFGPGLKVEPQFVSASTIGYLVKGGVNQGLAYTDGRAALKRAVRSPSWTSDGSAVVYEKVDFKPQAQNTPLYSWSADYEYRYTDVFPTVANDGKLVVTEKAVSDGTISIMDADGSNKQRIYSAGSAAFAPAWSPNGEWIAFGLGGYLQARRTKPATIMLVRRDGTGARELTPDSLNAGFPSWSPDGKRIAYRFWGATEGLRIMDVATGAVQVLTTEYDNMPFWSPDGSLIAFTRKHDGNNFDIYTIRPDGSGLRQLTTTPANDAHAVWTADSKFLMWNSGIYGFKDEAALYDNTFQPYGGIFVMNADGSNKRQLTDSPWEDSMPRYVKQPGKTP